MKYRNTANGIISTFVKLSFLSMSICYASNLEGAAAIHSYSYVQFSISVAWLSVGYVMFAVGWTWASNNACECWHWIKWCLMHGKKKLRLLKCHCLRKCSRGQKCGSAEFDETCPRSWPYWDISKPSWFCSLTFSSKVTGGVLFRTSRSWKILLLKG